MKNLEILVRFQIEGFHRWPQAPETVAYLRFRHRHIFYIEVVKGVTHADRDIEIITFKNKIQNYLQDRYKGEFSTMSCEDIAKDIFDKFKCSEVTVLEDNENGGRIKK